MTARVEMTWWHCTNCGAHGEHWMSGEILKDVGCPVWLNTQLMRGLGGEPEAVCEKNQLVVGSIPRLELVAAL